MNTDLDESRHGDQRDTCASEPVLQEHLEEGESDDLSDDEGVERVAETASENEPTIVLVVSSPEDVGELWIACQSRCIDRLV